MSLSSSIARLGGRVKYRLAMFRLDVQKVLTCQSVLLAEGPDSL